VYRKSSTRELKLRTMSRISRSFRRCASAGIDIVPISSKTAIKTDKTFLNLVILNSPWGSKRTTAFILKHFQCQKLFASAVKNRAAGDYVKIRKITAFSRP
jgi:hypothetical protein